MKKGYLLLIVVLALVSLVTVGCGQTSQTTTPSTGQPGGTPPGGQQPGGPPPGGQQPGGTPTGEPSSGTPSTGEPSSGTPSAAEPQASLTVDKTSIQSGECVTLEWSVQGEGVFGVTLDGKSVSDSGQQQECPTETTVYKLAVDIGETMVRRDVTVTVTGAGEEQTSENVTDSQVVE